MLEVLSVVLFVALLWCVVYTVGAFIELLIEIYELLKLFNYPWTKLECPRGLPMRFLSYKEGDYCWEDWEEDTRAAYPVRWFFQKTVPDWFRCTLKRNVSQAWYWLRTHTYNRYHMLDLRSPQNGYKWGWLDRSEGLLYANFNMFKDFYEKEYPGHVGWESDEDHSRVNKEMKVLYDWWTGGRATEQKASWDEFTEKIMDLPSTPARTKLFKKWSAKHDKIEAKDDKMLIRLIKIRHYLWT